MNRLPLFPLGTVLFPGGPLQLRIFERRYLDLVRDCARDGSSFGVCLILAGREAGEPATPAAIGTSARITDFFTREDGLLGITAVGERRFHVDSVHARDNGLLVAQVRWLDAEPGGGPVPAQHGLLATVLRDLLERFDDLPDDATLLDDAAWVAWRLAEILPLAPADRQVLLQLDEAEARLDRLAQWLPRIRGGDDAPAGG
ncbi:MAG: LON peptidase substrate-binding domain-containing protein [Xanthomonadales bacterium]|nr:LON peptidase substrate-binding domain-containing protein [Xanthomonadales bacterium]